MQPHYKPEETVNPQSGTAEESNYGKNEMLITPNTPPAPTKHKDTTQGGYQRTPRWKIVLEVAAFLTLLGYTTLTYFLLRESQRQSDIAQRTFTAVNRPYIGVSGISRSHVFTNAAGERIMNTRPTPKTDNMTYNVEVRNSGTVPGTHYTGHQRVLLGDEDVTARYMHGIPDQPATIFAGETVYQVGNMGGDIYRDIMNGKKTFRIEFTVEYDGPSEHYRDCDVHQYSPEVNEFVDLGACPKH